MQCVIVVFPGQTHLHFGTIRWFVHLPGHIHLFLLSIAVNMTRPRGYKT